MSGERFPSVAGPVDCLIADGSGGWFLGGAFVGIGGQSRSGLAHVEANGKVSSWDPHPNGEVMALALSGGTLLVAGNFDRIGGLDRSHLARVEVCTGRVTSWKSDADGTARCLLVRDTTVLIGGDFTQVSGERRMGAAEVSLRDGTPTQWNPDVETSGVPGSVRCMCRVGNSIYMGGAFWFVDGQRHRNLTEVDIRTGIPTSWSPDVMTCNCNSFDPPASVEQILPSEHSTLYVCGHFDRVNDVDRGGLAEVDRTTGAPTGWDAHLGPRFQDEAPTVRSMALGDGTLYIGSSTMLAGQDLRPGLAELRTSDATATPWNPRVDGPPKTLVVNGGALVAAGYFNMLGYTPRKDLAAIDLRTGDLLPWNPSPDGFGVLCLSSTTNQVFVGGEFNQIGGVPRAHLAALDTHTGAPVPWRGDADATVEALDVDGNTLLVGGGFRNIAGTARPFAAAFDLSSGALTPWAPAPDHDVYAIASAGQQVYLGGLFSSIGGLPRSYFAAVDSKTGAALDWHPSLDGQVFAIATSSDRIFIGGGFQAVGGASRAGLAALDGVSGELLAWGEGLYGDGTRVQIHGLQAHDGNLYACGHFSSLSGHPRSGIAALDIETGQVTDWDAHLGGSLNQPGFTQAIVSGIAIDNSNLLLGGRFSWSGVEPLNGLAAVRIWPGDGPRRNRPRLMREPHFVVTPNPASSSATLRLHLASAAAVAAAVFDPTGRCVARLAAGELLAAGDHEFGVPLGNLRPGVYFCRLETPDGTTTEKLVVVSSGSMP